MRGPSPESVISSPRLAYLRRLVRQILSEVKGHIVEVGVYRGGSLTVLAREALELAPTARVIGVDTFAGHPYSDGDPVHKEGKFCETSMQLVRESVEPLGNVTLIQGRFEDLDPNFAPAPLVFVHVDCDLYHPIAKCIERLWPRLVAGGVMAFDDYFHPNCPGATKAVNEAFPAERIHLMHRVKDEIGCYVRKEAGDGTV